MDGLVSRKEEVVKECKLKSDLWGGLGESNIWRERERNTRRGLFCCF